MHLGFIMDGNRRWARKHALQTLLGHTKGGETMEQVIEWCLEEGVEIVSFWALAKKNIEERSPEELAYLYDLLLKKITELTPKLIQKGIRFETIGDLSLIPEECQKSLAEAKQHTATGGSMTLVIAIGYGGQDEIIRAIKRFIASGGDLTTLDERSFLPYLDSGVFPPPDLIVRTGGDVRHSGYFLYQAEYSEYYFTPTLWPDFSRGEFDRAIASLE